MPTFHFSGFKLHTAQPSVFYMRIAKQWTDADPDHSGKTSPGFWFEQGGGTESYILEDCFGVVFFFKMQRRGESDVELHIQFPQPQLTPREEAAQRDRVRRGLIQGLDWIEKALALRDVSRLFFISQNPNLIRFSVRHLGFSQTGERLEKHIHAAPG